MQNPIKIPMALITETEPKKSSNLYGTIKDPEKPKQLRQKKKVRLQTILQNYNNQNNKVLAQKHTHRLMEQNSESTNKPIHI